LAGGELLCVGSVAWVSSGRSLQCAVQSVVRSVCDGREVCAWPEICAVWMLCCRVVREEDVDYVVVDCAQCGVICMCESREVTRTEPRGKGGRSSAVEVLEGHGCGWRPHQLKLAECLCCYRNYRASRISECRSG
jgi:hypothetical protein